MATQDDVRRIALALPATTQNPTGFGFSVAGKAFVWAWLERVHPKRGRVPNAEVVAVRVADEFEKETLLGIDSAVFFTEAHYDGYPAVLVRLPAIDPDFLEHVLTEAWRCRAPRRLWTELDQTKTAKDEKEK
jgi:hypothetical protein